MTLTVAEIETKLQAIEGRMDAVERKPAVLTGMLPAAIKKILQLISALQSQSIKFSLIRGYDAGSSTDGFHTWGCAVDIECLDYTKLRQVAGPLGFTWTDSICTHSGHLELIAGLKISDFKTYRVNGDLKLIDAKY